MLVSLLPDTHGSLTEPEGNIAALQAFLQSPDFLNRPVGSAEEIETHIKIEFSLAQSIGCAYVRNRLIAQERIAVLAAEDQ